MGIIDLQTWHFLKVSSQLVMFCISMLHDTRGSSLCPHETGFQDA